MGRTPLPLTIAVRPEDLTRPVVQAWAEKGHIIQAVTGSWDVIFHPQAHFMTDIMWDEKYAEIALKGARARKREMKPPATKKEKKNAKV